MTTRRIYSRSTDRVVIDFNDDTHTISVAMTNGAAEQTISIALDSEQAKDDAISDVTGWLNSNKFFLTDTLTV